MDVQLRCNSLSCRAPLSDRAVVTTCSHIFCDHCSSKLVISESRHSSRICPACQAPLNNPDDVVRTSLNPSEDYKTSVLSGLSPTIILECATRGVGFFQYQAAQELMYETYMSRNLTEKYHVLGAQMDSVIADANKEIISLRDKLETAHSERNDLAKKNSELVEAFKAKSSALQKLQRLYQDSRRKADAVAVQDAAAVNVEDVLQQSSHSLYGNGPQRPAQAHMTGLTSPNGLLNRRGSSDHLSRPSGWQDHTPSHRQRLGFGGAISPNTNMYNPAPSNGIMNPTPVRQPLRNIDANAGLVNGYPRDVGISGRAKVGRSGVQTGSRASIQGARNSTSFFGTR